MTRRGRHHNHVFGVLNDKKKVLPLLRFELTTFRVLVRCSTTELHGLMIFAIQFFQLYVWFGGANDLHLQNSKVLPYGQSSHGFAIGSIENRNFKLKLKFNIFLLLSLLQKFTKLDGCIWTSINVCFSFDDCRLNFWTSFCH